MSKSGIELSETQKRALRYLAKYPADKWATGTPVNQRCLNVLHKRGLIKVCFDPSAGFMEMITDAGRDLIKGAK